MRFFCRGLLVLFGCLMLIFSTPQMLWAAPTSSAISDLNPFEYSILKNFTPEFCGAIEDGASVATAYEVAMTEAFWKSAGTLIGSALTHIGQEKEEVSRPEPDYEEIVLGNTRKCLTPTQSAELRSVLDELLKSEETAGS